MTELDGLALLADYGVPVVAHRAVDTPEAVVDAAAALGYPVVLKTAAPGISHKSDAGGVKLGLGDEAAVREAYADVATSARARRRGGGDRPARRRAGARDRARSRPSGRSSSSLPVASSSSCLKDRRLGRPPLDDVRAARLVDGLKMRPILDGVRGMPPVDVGSLAAAIARLSVLAVDLGDLVAAFDVNPVIVVPDGAVAVDALVVPVHA